MTTPQRALELAEERHYSIAALIHKSECRQLSQSEKARLDKLREEERIFRRYAEIMQAEPDVVLRPGNYGTEVDWINKGLDCYKRHKLIIKPEPLK